jgi:hypothetical protein
MKVYKIRDPKTGEFYTGEMYKTNLTSKHGKVYLTPATVKACLTRFGYDPRVSHLVNDIDMELVEYNLVEVGTKTVSELKNERTNSRTLG